MDLVTFTEEIFNPLSANLTKRSNTLKQFVAKLPTNCLSVFDHFVKLALKGLMKNFIFCTVKYVPWISESEEIESEKSKI